MNRCGCSCEECASWPDECPGCDATRGRVYWTRYIGAVVCPVYACCGEKAHNDCGECSEIPCETWFELKDPALSDEEHERSIGTRVQNLTRSKD